MAHRDPLAILSTISNRDKHNDVYVCVAAAGNPGFKLIRPALAPPDREITVRLGEKLTPHPMADGKEFFGLYWNPPSGAPPRPMGADIYLEVVDMQPVLGFESEGRTFTLDDIERVVVAVAAIVDRHTARFK